MAGGIAKEWDEAMRITDPVLVPDVSIWCNRINAKEFEDGDCQSVVVGLYPTTVNGKWVLNPTNRAQCVEVATHSQMVLQAYMWDDITLDPVMQANWAADTIAMEGLPIKYIWADDEQWWTSWAAWNQARAGKIPMSAVPRASAGQISAHMAVYMSILHKRFPQSGVYTNKGFVNSWALPMNGWLAMYESWVPQYYHEPNQATQMSWQQLKAQWLPNYDIDLLASQLPGLLRGHQFTGDLIKLPGAYDQYNQEQVLDVSIFSKAFIDSLRGGAVPVPPPIPQPVQVGNYIVITLSWIFATPNDGAGCKLVGQTAVGMPVTVEQIQGVWAQLSQPIAGWVRLADLRKV